ncbi:Hypothetical predicted protein [Mytilus galloprovincialis]|uniref:Methyltransferase domain-containing protein n=1 Tax=Mytilus galloprovincialis TaxID=29158 RepID=A0A8B6E5K1_MYTGA|nr:Hypothetical predicted protein [Mytilus galloprovincialis]
MADDSFCDVEKMVNDGLHSMVLAIGYKVGIVTVIIDSVEPCTAEEISNKANLNKRYVEEWLICMTAKGVVKIDDGKYYFPNKKQISEAAFVSTMLPIFAECFPDLEKVMKNKTENKGYPFPQKALVWEGQYKELSSFHDVTWLEDNVKPVIKSYFKDNKTNAATFNILDFGCGYGKLAFSLAKTYSNSLVWGVDIDAAAIDAGRNKAQKNSCLNVFFEKIVDGNMPDVWKEKFDFIIMSDVLHDLPDPNTIMANFRTVLKPGGYVIAFDPPIYTDHKKNIGYNDAIDFMPYSVFTCLPNSMSEKPAIGHGIGWGYEDKLKYIESQGFQVLAIDGEDVKFPKWRIVFQQSV